MTAFVVLNLLFGACNPSIEPTPTPIPTAYVKSDLIKTYELGIEGQNYSLVGDTTLPKNTTPLHPLPTQMADLASLKNANGTFKYVAVGASLTAGVRDGGWFNEGMSTAYPNLIARQMGITNFKQPLFSDTEFNGYGLKLQTINKETPINRYKAVSNNLAIKAGGTDIILTPFDGKELNNYAVMNLTDGGFYDSFLQNNTNNTFYKLTLKRILGQPQTAIETQITSGDLISVEPYQQGILKFALSGGQQSQHLPSIITSLVAYPLSIIDISYTGGTDLLLFKLYQKGLKKYILLNIPNTLKLPYFKKCTRFSALKTLFQKYNLGYGFDLDETLMLFPTPAIDSLFSYQNSSEKLINFYSKKFLKSSTPIGLGIDEQNKVIELQKIYNEHLSFLSKKYSTPVVDINSLYEKISNGTFVSDEGRKVTEKEFFSSDGLYPTAYGQALIANECIKTINTFYKTNITLIKTEYYIKR